MTNQSSIPEFICDPFGTSFRVDKKRTILMNAFIKYGLFFPTPASAEPTRKFRNQHPSCIPNFVCDPCGSVFRVDGKLTKILNKYIYLISILVSSIDAKDLKESTTSQQQVPRHDHHRNFAHRRPIKQRHCLSKRWLIAIVLKQLLVVWDLWTYKRGLYVISANPSLEYRNK